MKRREDLQDYLKIYKNRITRWYPPFLDKQLYWSKVPGVLPFVWGRDGTVIDSDNGIWTHGRFVWLLATIYYQVEPKPEWLELAQHGIEFLEKYGFDQDGRMFFLVSQSGKLIRKRRYIFSEAFAVVAFSAYAKVSGEAHYQDKAEAFFKFIQKLHNEPGLLKPKLI